jgi:hypothetical protein
MFQKLLKLNNCNIYPDSYWDSSVVKNGIIPFQDQYCKLNLNSFNISRSCAGKQQYSYTRKITLPLPKSAENISTFFIRYTSAHHSFPRLNKYFKTKTVKHYGRNME